MLLWTFFFIRYFKRININCYTTIYSYIYFFSTHRLVCNLIFFFSILCGHSPFLLVFYSFKLLHLSWFIRSMYCYVTFTSPFFISAVCCLYSECRIFRSCSLNLIFCSVWNIIFHITLTIAFSKSSFSSWVYWAFKTIQSHKHASILLCSVLGFSNETTSHLFHILFYNIFPEVFSLQDFVLSLYVVSDFDSYKYGQPIIFFLFW